MKLEDLKNGWTVLDNQANELLKEKEDVLINKVINSRFASLQKRLIQRYRVTTIICLVCLLGFIFQNNSFLYLGAFVAYGFMIFFTIMGICNGSIWWKLAHLNHLRMTVRESLLETYRLERNKKWGFIIGLIMAIPLMTGYIFKLTEKGDTYTIAGAGTGIIVGIYVGIRIHKRIKKEFREIREILEQE